MPEPIRQDERGPALPLIRTAPVPPGPEDQARADFYSLLAALLLAPPEPEFLSALAGADALACRQADSSLETAWETLVATAAVMDAEAVRDEFNAIYVGLGDPRVDPYASRYLSGFLNEKPLAALREELARLGLARLAGAAQMEDHLGALCETMRLLITGGPGLPRRPLQVQQTFFGRYIAPWHARCLNDIRAVPGVGFYARVADLAQAFFEIEQQAFEMEGNDEHA